MNCGELRSPSDLARHGVARRATGDAACFSYARTRNRTMACDTSPLRSPTFARVSRTSEVALARAVRATCGNVTKSAGDVFLLEVRSDPDFRVELDETRSLHPPSRPPRTFKTTLSFVRTHYDAHPIAHVKASHRSKSLRCSSETENDLRDDTVTNASRYLGAVRAGHDEPSARSPSFAQLEIPGLEAVRRSR